MMAHWEIYICIYTYEDSLVLVSYEGKSFEINDKWLTRGIHGNEILDDMSKNSIVLFEIDQSEIVL